jgi:uridine kinase
MSRPPPAPRIVAFAGPPGSGKTTLMTELARLWPQASLLFFDGFPEPSGMAAEALADWLGRGADLDALQIPGLAEALAALKAGRDVVEPASGRKVAAAPVILFEMPLGRAWRATAPLIDALVWIDTPLDVALARNVLAWEAAAADWPRDWLARYMEQYVAVTRDVLTAQRAAIMGDADLVLDGLGDPSDLAAQAAAFLTKVSSPSV